MIPISSPGRRTEGFATLDALIAILVLSITLSGVAGWAGTLRIAAQKRELLLKEILDITTERESSNWFYNASNQSEK